MTDKQKRCETMMWGTTDEDGLHGERLCGNPAVGRADPGKKYEMFVCAECALDVHPSRMVYDEEAKRPGVWPGD